MHMAGTNATFPDKTRSSKFKRPDLDVLELEDLVLPWKGRSLSCHGLAARFGNTCAPEYCRAISDQCLPNPMTMSFVNRSCAIVLNTTCARLVLSGVFVQMPITTACARLVPFLQASGLGRA